VIIRKNRIALLCLDMTRMLVFHMFLSFFVGMLYVLEDEDEELCLIETALFWGWKWLFLIRSLKFLNLCIQTPSLLISDFNPLIIELKKKSKKDPKLGYNIHSYQVRLDGLTRDSGNSRPWSGL